MAYLDTYCPRGGHKQPETMLCPGCEPHLTQRLEKRVFGLDHRSFVFWKTRIAAALNLWRSKTGELVALDHMQECHKQVPDLYAAMVCVPPDQLGDWPNDEMMDRHLEQIQPEQTTSK